MNPPDDDHWISHVETELLARGLDGVEVIRLVMPPGEKSAHFERMAEITKGQEARDWAEAAAGVDLLTVKALGGWGDLTMVQRYAHLAPEHRREANVFNGVALRVTPPPRARK